MIGHNTLLTSCIYVHCCFAVYRIWELEFSVPIWVLTGLYISYLYAIITHPCLQGIIRQ